MLGYTKTLSKVTWRVDMKAAINQHTKMKLYPLQYFKLVKFTEDAIMSAELLARLEETSDI